MPHHDNPTHHPNATRADAPGTLGRLIRFGACGLTAALLLAACDRSAVAPAASGRQAVGAAASFDRQTDGGSSDVNRELAELRRLTAPFHDISAAKAADWNVQLTGCMENPPAGGMGYHYANLGLIDGTAEVQRPQLLLYEPEKNGRMRLVAVEYIIPYSFVPETAPAPRLFGQAFHKNAAFQLWGLHAWVWEHNPSGMFADWNPRVSCQYAK